MVPAEWNSSSSPLTSLELCPPNCSLAPLPPSASPSLSPPLPPSLSAVPVGKAVALGLVLLVFTVCGVGGNVLVILSVALHRHLRSATHLFVVNLAVADLLLSAAVLPFSLAAELLGRWVFGRLLCSVWTAVDVLCCTASILSLCAISVDRYLAVSRPLRYPALVTGRRGGLALVLLWTLAASISVGPLLGWREPMPDDEGVCRVNEDPSYALFSALGSFYVPLAVILVMYCRVYVVARRHSRAHSGQGRSVVSTDQVTLRIHTGSASSQQQNGAGAGDAGAGGGGGGGKRRSSAQDEGSLPGKRSSSVSSSRGGRCGLLRLLRFSREQKAAKTLGVVVGCFVLCWLPFFLVLPIGAMFPAYHPSETVFKVTFWLGYFNSCLNPIIYPCFSQEFKRAFLSVLRSPCLQCSTQPQNSQSAALRLSYRRRSTQPPPHPPPPTPPPVGDRVQFHANGAGNGTLHACVGGESALFTCCEGGCCEDRFRGACLGVVGGHHGDAAPSDSKNDSSTPPPLGLPLAETTHKAVRLTLNGSQGTAV